MKENINNSGSTGKPAPSEQHPVDELRDLLFGQEKERIEEIHRRLEDPQQRAKEISHILAEALRMRWRQDDKIARAIQPAVEASLLRSVRSNPKALVDAIFPVMGPAIRKAISAAIMGMIQSLNQLVNHSVSLQGLKWRIEALKARKPFAEVVLLHTLRYRVEQIFLIHKETGLVLHHVAAEQAGPQDPDLVSGMLTAIQDFVQDSFGGRDEEQIDTLRMGNQRSVWLEQGPHAIAAAVIQGTPPLDLRADIRDTLDTIHINCGEALLAFNGDTAPFETLAEELRGLLQVRLMEINGRPSPILWVLFFLFLGVFTVGTFFFIHRHREWEHYLTLLQAEPGIVVVNSDRRNGSYHVEGLRDPLSKDPSQVLAESNLNPETVVAAWRPYQSMEKTFILSRAKLILQPPDGVRLTYANGKLIAEGFAGHRWVTMARNTAPAIAGVIHFEEKGLVDMDLNQFRQYKDRLEHKIIYFKKGSVQLEAGQAHNLEDLAGIVKTLQRLSSEAHIESRIDIYGHTDASGSDRVNLSLSRMRAEKMLGLLAAAGADPFGLLPVGMGAVRSMHEEKNQNHPQVDRSVTFLVTHRKAVLHD